MLVLALVIATAANIGSQAKAANTKVLIFSGSDEHWVPLQVAKTKGLLYC